MLLHKEPRKNLRKGILRIAKAYYSVPSRLKFSVQTEMRNYADIA